ncbi:hypothetical protein GA0074695_1533 [Micromonospora viridifaciens]|uniref:Helix-turn-helix domain-containing protein n=1 Tax=Micromonospora viridifaciens TaxID=1881 RepID=A0A1C4VK42_MICVI|nr:hypothetical protein GA0074695_1533 [Micromonospora viridifaciens]
MSPPDPDVARLIAEEVLRHRGEFQASIAYLHALIRRQLPDSPASESAAATATHIRWARRDLGAFGIATRRQPSGPGRREWCFRLVAVPVETRSEAS